MANVGRWMAVGLGGLLLAGVCGCPPTSVPDASREQFRQSRHEVELQREIDSLQMKLAAERLASTQSESRADRLEKELVSVENTREHEKAQYDVALRLNADLKLKLESLEAELKKVKADLAKLQPH